MPQLREKNLIDEIRAFVHSADQTQDPRIAELARQYGELCRSANERLTRCAEFLERGLRTQAIDLAEAEPDLLGLVALLQFPECQHWHALAASYGWERFQVLKTEIANQISAAYHIEHQLRPILKTHRLLALRKSPLKDRLQVLRQIAAVDVTTPFWREDIAEFESQRCAELLTLCQQAEQQEELDAMAQAVSEYESEQWLFVPSPELVRRYGALMRNFHVAQSLPIMARQIERAYRENQLVSLRNLCEKWKSLTEKIRESNPGWQTPEYLTQLVAHAFQFVGQRNQEENFAAYTHDLENLQAAIVRERPPAEVNLMLEKALSHGFQLPVGMDEALEQWRYRHREAKYISAGFIVTLVMTGIGILVFAFFMIRQAKS